MPAKASVSSGLRFASRAVSAAGRVVSATARPRLAISEGASRASLVALRAARAVAATQAINVRTDMSSNRNAGRGVAPGRADDSRVRRASGLVGGYYRAQHYARDQAVVCRFAVFNRHVRLSRRAAHRLCIQIHAAVGPELHDMDIPDRQRLPRGEYSGRLTRHDQPGAAGRAARQPADAPGIDEQGALLVNADADELGLRLILVQARQEHDRAAQLGTRRKV